MAPLPKKANSAKRNSLEARLSDIDRQLQRKMEMLVKQVNFTELLDESSRQEAEQLEANLKELLAGVDSLASQVQDTTVSLRRLADGDQTQRIAELEKEIAVVDTALMCTENLIEIADLVEAAESCGHDAATALIYLDRIEQACRALDTSTRSGGRLRIIESVSQYLVNRRYTLESEQRRMLKTLQAEAKTDLFDEDKNHNENEGDSVKDHVDNGNGSFLGKMRDILRKPLEPTEELTNEDFGGPGDVDGIRVSFWLRPLVIEILALDKPSLAINLYISFYKHSMSSLPLKSVAIFYCNSMYIAHRMLLHCLVHRSSRMTLDSAVVLRQFADTMFLGRLRKLRFDSSTQIVDEVAFKEYPKFLRKYCSELREVLPSNVSRKVIRLLAEHYVGSLICVVGNTEDIESAQADRWATLVGEILDELRDITSGVHIRTLGKAEELRNILSYSLKDFAAHWKNANSQLRTWYEPEEVKHLIRAIFQNSPMRSSVLGQIK